MKKHRSQWVLSLVNLFTVLGLIATLALVAASPLACGRELSSTPDLSGLFYYEEGSSMPRLTAEGKARAKEIALSDVRVIRLLEGKDYVVAQKYNDGTPNTRIGIWHTSEDLKVIGAALEIWFDRPYTIDFGSATHRAEALLISVSFLEERVVEIHPL